MPPQRPGDLLLLEETLGIEPSYSPRYQRAFERAARKDWLEIEAWKDSIRKRSDRRRNEPTATWLRIKDLRDKKVTMCHA